MAPSLMQAMSTTHVREFLGVIPKQLRRIKSEPKLSQGPISYSRCQNSKRRHPRSVMLINDKCHTCGNHNPTVTHHRASSIWPSQCFGCRREQARLSSIQKLATTEQTMPTFEDPAAVPLLTQSQSEPSRALAVNQEPICDKCGKRKKPPSEDTEGEFSSKHVSFSTPLPAGHIARQHVMYAEQRKPLHYFTGVPKRKPVPSRIETRTSQNTTITINITPPTVVSEHPTPNDLTHPTTQETPILGTGLTQPSSGPVHQTSTNRISSIDPTPLPTQNSSNDDAHRQEPDDHHKNRDSFLSARGLMDLISDTVRSSGTPRYTRLDDDDNDDEDTTDTHQRSESVFSFVAGTGNDSIELGDLSKTSPTDTVDSSAARLLAPYSEPQLIHEPSFDPHELVSQLCMPPDYSDSLATDSQNRPEHVPFSTAATPYTRLDTIAEREIQQPSRFRSLRRGNDGDDTYRYNAGDFDLGRSSTSLEYEAGSWFGPGVSVEGAATRVVAVR